jgi:DNA modification methylase
MSVTLLQGDCLEVMYTIADGSVDMILADLPYGTTACKWDTIIPLEPLWAHYKRVIKRNGAIVLTASQPFTTTLIASQMAMFRYTWVWDKGPGTGFMNARKQPLKCHEDVIAFYSEQPTYNPQKWAGLPNHTRRQGYFYKNDSIYAGAYCRPDSDVSGMKYPRSILAFPKHSASEPLQPTQKPVALMEYLIRTYTNEGETVLDNVMGSGTTLVGCVNTNRNGIGIERDPEYFRVAQDRIAKAQSTAKQLQMEAIT